MNKPISAKDAFGFGFWLGWSVGFAGSVVLSAALWTFFLTKVFGVIPGAELTLSWSAAVFGTWFLFLVPFMRKKERIWKRLNADQEKAADLWLAGIGLIIGSFIVALCGWSFIFRAHLHRTSAGFYGPWLKAVMMTWLACLAPFLVVMYRRADELFQAAKKRQTQHGPVFKSAMIEKSKRMLSAELAKELAAVPETLENGKVVSLTLKDGREIQHAFVLNSREILGLYDCEIMDFAAADVARVRTVPPEAMPVYDESRWLRLDGRA